MLTIKSLGLSTRFLALAIRGSGWLATALLVMAALPAQESLT